MQWSFGCLQFCIKEMHIAWKNIIRSKESTVPPVYSGSLIVIMAVAAMALCFGYPTLLNKKKKKRCQYIYPEKLPITTTTYSHVHNHPVQEQLVITILFPKTFFLLLLIHTQWGELKFAKKEWNILYWVFCNRVYVCLPLHCYLLLLKAEGKKKHPSCVRQRWFHAQISSIQPLTYHACHQAIAAYP